MDGDGNGGAEELLELTRDSVYAGCAFFFFGTPMIDLVDAVLWIGLSRCEFEISEDSELLILRGGVVWTEHVQP